MLAFAVTCVYTVRGRNVEGMVAMEGKLVYTRKELGLAMGVSRSKVDQLIKEPGFPAIKLGKSIVIPRDRLKAWMDGQANKET